MPAEHAYVADMPPLMTADEFLMVHIPDKRLDLVRGVLVVREPPGYQHARTLARLTGALISYVDTHQLGHVLAGDPGFQIAKSPDTVRGPDIAFIRRERVPDPPPHGFAALAPDLVVEVRSPGDRPGDVLAKVGDWLSSGTPLVWVIDPAHRVAHVYRQDGTQATIGPHEALHGEEVLPGFSCPLDAIL